LHLRSVIKLVRGGRGGGGWAIDVATPLNGPLRADCLTGTERLRVSFSLNVQVKLFLGLNEGWFNIQDIQTKKSLALQMFHLQRILGVMFMYCILPATNEQDGCNYDKDPAGTHDDQTELEQPKVAALEKIYMLTSLVHRRGRLWKKR
jgi:hypothetical protein